jgi:large subunit ribosomal protein L29
MTKATELREMSSDQLTLTLQETKKNLFHLRIQSQTERLSAPSEVRKQRRLIARIRTIQNERQRAAEVAAEKITGKIAEKITEKQEQANA